MPGLATLIRTNVVKVSKFNPSITRVQIQAFKYPTRMILHPFILNIGTHLIMQASTVSPIYDQPGTKF